MPVVPSEANDLVSAAVPVISSYLDDHGRIISVPLWVESADGVIRFSTPKGTKKTTHLRPGSEMSFVFTDPQQPFRYLTVSGRVSEVHDDDDLACIDRLAHRYVGGPYQWRDQPRDVVVVEPARIKFSPGTW